MLLLFFLFASLSSGVGSSHDITKYYGERYKIMLTYKAVLLEFKQTKRLKPVVLWNRTNPKIESSNRVLGIFYMMYNLTQADSGQYITRDKAGVALETYNIYITYKTKSYFGRAGAALQLSFYLDPQICNIYFSSESKMRMFHMVSNGTLTRDGTNSGCTYIELDQPCAISNTYLQTACQGTYEFRDHNDNKAFLAVLTVEEEEVILSPIGITIGVLSILSACCSCLKHCCCGSTKNKEEEEGSPENEPAVQYTECDGETVRIKSGDSTPDVRDSAQPFSSETGPLMPPPPYEAFKPSEDPVSNHRAPDYGPPDYGAPDHRAPDYGASSIISEPRFSVKDMSFPSVLDSGPTSHDVYTSDKLSFR